jgi:hypothetical protein
VVSAASSIDVWNEKKYDGELNIGGPNFASISVDVLNPFLVVVEIVRGNADYFHVALGKIPRTTCDFPELGCADGGEVC